MPACANALAAADLDAALVRPSRRTDDAAVAAFDDVVFAGAPDWDSALPAAVFDREPVEGFWSVFDAFEAARPPVVLPICTFLYRCGTRYPGLGSPRGIRAAADAVRLQDRFCHVAETGKKLNAPGTRRQEVPPDESLLQSAGAIDQADLTSVLANVQTHKARMAASISSSRKLR